MVERASTAIPAIENRSVARLLEHLRVHLREPVNIAEVAEGLGVSRATLDRRFQEETGQTPHDYLVQQRIQAAKEMLLAGSTASLEEISRACGFTNRRRMNLVFKQVTGVLPAQWRQSQPPVPPH